MNASFGAFFRLLTRPWFILCFVGVVLATVVAFSINRIMIAILHSRTEVVVPKIEGKTLLDALAIVSSLDLSIQQEGTDFDEGLPAGTIIRQHPPSGMNVRTGRALRVVVSKGGQVVFVPEIIGKPIAEAQSILASNGIQMGALAELYSVDAAKGAVLRQEPSSGTIVTRGALVDVDISRGLPPVGLPLLPDFIGKSVAEAQEWATGVQAGVKLKEDPKGVGPPGTVIKQDPIPGQPLLEGAELRLTIVPLEAAQKGPRFTYQVPAELNEAQIRIMARDNVGEAQVYEGKHKGGFTIEIPVTLKSTTRFRVYVDDVLKEERVLEP